MAKRSVQKIPKSVILVCPHCGKGTTAKVCIEFSPQVYSCPKCKEEVRTPLASCCVVCAFSKSGTKCPRELYMKAKVRGWEIK